MPSLKCLSFDQKHYFYICNYAGALRNAVSIDNMYFVKTVLHLCLYITINFLNLNILCFC